MRRWTTIAIAIILMGVSAPLSAETVSDSEASSAQVQMQNRAISSARAYAKEIGLTGDWLNYCWLEMNRKAEHQKDGTIPFGVIYRGIERGSLNLTIEILEMWMRNETVLCLARVKGDLTRAAEAAGKQ